MRYACLVEQPSRGKSSIGHYTGCAVSFSSSPRALVAWYCSQFLGEHMKPLDAKDFRAFRLVLEPSDFALGPDQPDPPPSDLIDKDTWQSMMSLPDDVSIRTSNEYGTALRALWDYWDQWNCLVGALQDGSAPLTQCPISHVACDASDEFQTAVFCSVTGHYRAAFSCLRNVVEQMTVALQLELSGKLALFQDWVNGQEELKLGWAADLLPKNATVSALESHWRNAVGDDLFSQKRQASTGGGFVRRLFSELSKFTHGAPGFTDSDMRNSNGPIFVSEAYEGWLNKFRQVYALAILEAQIAKPKTRALAHGSKQSSQSLFNAVLADMLPGTDGHRLLASTPSVLWR